jgi:hypothetical protein
MWLNKFQEAYSLLNEFKYRQVTETDREVTYRFSTSKYEYEVAFENTSHGWEIIFGVLVNGQIDTTIVVGEPGEVRELLETIFNNILTDFIKLNLEYESEFNILLAPQLMEGESSSLSPFERKRGRLYLRKIKETVATNSFYKGLEVTYSLSKFYPPCIVMGIQKIIRDQDQLN